MTSKKVIIIQESDSDSDSSSDSDTDTDELPSHFKTQQNKKSLIKVNDYNYKQAKPINPTKKYFVD